MLLRLQNSLTSMSEMTRQQERIANNLANANTIGYKRDRMFAEELGRHLDTDGALRSDRALTQWADLQQGSLEQTGNPLDVALDGNGFFVLTDEAREQTLYSRAGHFVLDAEGYLRTPYGLLVEGEGGPLQVPAGASQVEIGRDGMFKADGQEIGKLRVVTFEAPDLLQRREGATFFTDALEPEDVEQPIVLQGTLEKSNVDPVREMTDMITHFRIFEAQQKMLQTTDQLLGEVTRDLGRF